MTHRPLSLPQSEASRVFGPLDGARVPGGCDTCDAFQTAEPSGAGVWLVTVHHDDWCPTLAAMQDGRG